eukprot:scaffold13544_cov21-Tisochrysis_lutea.AAC.1
MHFLTHPNCTRMSKTHASWSLHSLHPPLAGVPRHLCNPSSIHACYCSIYAPFAAYIGASACVQSQQQMCVPLHYMCTLRSIQGCLSICAIPAAYMQATAAHMHPLQHTWVPQHLHASSAASPESAPVDTRVLKACHSSQTGTESTAATPCSIKARCPVLVMPPKTRSPDEDQDALQRLECPTHMPKEPVMVHLPLVVEVAAPANLGVVRGWHGPADNPEELEDMESSLCLLAA